MLLGTGVGATVHLVAAQPQDASPEARAIAFLAGEVPRWPVENNCFSCHNNGDAARALYTAVGQDYAVEAEALRDTTAWLQNPAAWDDNALGLEFADQTDAGSWELDTSGSIGSPATYGRALATWAALRALRQADRPDLAPVIARADAWVRDVEVQTVIDAAARVLALGGADDRAALAQRQRCLVLLMEGLAPSGGWGAYLASVVEPFDTALVVLALQPLLGRSELAVPAIDAGLLTEMVAGGRAFLLEAQLGDGSWVETTRPAGQQSYAQYISTTAWATLALLATR